MELSVCGCRLPSVSRCPSSASRLNGSAAARSPLVCSSAPRLPIQRLSGGEVALGPQQQAEAADRDERARMPFAVLLACHLQRFAEQRLSGGEVTLLLQQHAEVIDGGERVRMPIAEHRASHLQHLAEQRLSLVVVALAYVLATRALELEPCTQKLEAQRITVLVHALAAAVGCVLLWARAPPVLEAVSMDPHGGAAARARLNEWAVALVAQA
eukprot:scaffold22225_cov72-Phaeocystis_antarctica.AAC.5